jgi:hypothetical protein
VCKALTKYKNKALKQITGATKSTPIITVLTAWSRVLLEKLTGFQVVKKFPAFYGTRRFITAITSAPPSVSILSHLDPTITSKEIQTETKPLNIRRKKYILKLAEEYVRSEKLCSSLKQITNMTNFHLLCR